MRSNFYFCFTINYEQAKAFRNANGQYLRSSQWKDITVEVTKLDDNRIVLGEFTENIRLESSDLFELK